MTIRKAIPLIWKYLLVVFTSCMLAFAISKQVRAAPPGGSSLAAAKQYQSTGAFAVKVQDETWQDAARQRAMQVRILSPDTPTTPDRFPVVIFSHGLGGNKSGGKFWGEHWATHGYIVVHLQHPGSDESVWRGKQGKEAAASLTAAMTMGNLALRVGDVHFAIDEIIRRGKTGDGVFKMADWSKIGMSGHSFGAQTTLAVAGQATPAGRGQSGLDKRIRAAIAFSPNARNPSKPERQFGDIRMPFFSVTGTKDGAVLNDATLPVQRILPHQHMPPGDKYLAVYEDGDHMVFGGHPLSGRRPATARDAEIQEDVKASTLAFWNAYLKDDHAARNWLVTADTGFRTRLAAADQFETK